LPFAECGEQLSGDQHLLIREYDAIVHISKIMKAPTEHPWKTYRYSERSFSFCNSCHYYENAYADESKAKQIERKQHSSNLIKRFFHCFTSFDMTITQL
jgi:hypothetical protein